MKKYKNIQRNLISLARYNIRIVFGGKFVYFILAAFGFFLLLTAALATLPVIGMCWQAIMATLHLCMGVGAVLATVVYLVASLKKKA